MAELFSGKVEIKNTDTDQVVITLDGGDDEAGANAFFGGNGQDGDLAVRDSQGNNRIWLSGDNGRINLQDEEAHFVGMLDTEGDFVLGGGGKNGTITLRNAAFTETLRLDGATGDVVIRDWTISAPDYVFEEGYALSGLEEVEQYVRSQKHLPGMPSASEILSQGVHLSSFCMQLLKQVEELTLHAIRQERVIADQESRLALIESDHARSVT